MFLITLILANSLKRVNNIATPIFTEYAKTEIRKIINNIINETISEEDFNKLNPSELYNITKGENDEIILLDINTQNVNKLLGKISGQIDKRIKEEEQNDCVNIKIPIGIIFDNVFTNNIGPRITIKTKTIGNITSYVTTEVKDYGINNALIEIYASIKITEKIILPLSTSDVIIESKIPIMMHMIKGKVPSYYSNGVKDNSPNFSIPIE